MHPAIIALARVRLDGLARQGHRLLFYEAALLMETGRHREMDLLIVVVADDELRVERLMRRSSLSRQQVIERISAQLSQEVKASAADYLIDNSGDLSHTRERVREIWQDLQARLPGELGPDGEGNEA